ncbi:hypothetical protein DBR22_08895 [Arthrobacter sp. HMWF013]|nr:hypothetical protein DBR22_08895 [Arthrobacter sp. HMWF013]
MAKVFPDAEIVVGVADPALARDVLPGRRVRSLLSPSLPGILTHWARYAPLLWLAWRFCKIDADLVVVSSHFGGHQVCHRTSGKTIVYYHTPMRIAWKFEMEKHRVSGPAARLLRTLIPAIQYVDRLPASKASRRIANSTETQTRIRDYYGCDSEVLYPPVEISSMPSDSNSKPSEPYYLCFGRLVDYKRVDHAILACNQLDRRLVIVGTGPAEKSLRTLAGSRIQFMGQVNDAAKVQLMTNATALVFPGLEDFGIVPVEAMSHGVPVIALGKGGVLDTVTPSTGVLYDDATPSGLAQAIEKFELKSFDPKHIRSHASKFAEINFRSRLADIVSTTMASDDLAR